MIWRQKAPRANPLYPEWVRVEGIVTAIYEKSIIYSVPCEYFRKRVRLPLSALEVRPLADSRNIMVRGWLAHREGLPEFKER